MSSLRPPPPAASLCASLSFSKAHGAGAFVNAGYSCCDGRKRGGVEARKYAKELLTNTKDFQAGNNAKNNTKEGSNTKDGNNTKKFLTNLREFQAKDNTKDLLTNANDNAKEGNKCKKQYKGLADQWKRQCKGREQMQRTCCRGCPSPPVPTPPMIEVLTTAVC
jgi:hypothetical protein